ncbi:minor capsid component [Caudoviricetes sp.]|nr:minor capsid component [Caudoviricetes sp.]UOF81501.1 minor capsid component [Caudoviricetes sp.]
MTTRNKTLSAWQKQRRAQKHVLLTAAHERALIYDLEKVFKAITRSAAKLVEAGQYDQAEKVAGTYQGPITRIFEGRLEAAAYASAQLVLEELTGAKSAVGMERKFFSLFEIAQTAVRAWINAYAAAKVVRILETTRLRIRRSIERGNEQDEPPRVLAKRIREETGGEIARRRAETIARTETGIAASVGADTAAEATGLQLDKEWTSSEDQRVRPDHAKADGQIVAMNAMFDVGGSLMRFPRDPNGPPNQTINCRCVCIYKPRIPK